LFSQKKRCQHQSILLPFLHTVFPIKLNYQMMKILFWRHDFSDALPM
jgi:hypothetical protein